MAEISKKTTDRLKISGSVIAALNTQGEVISTAVDAGVNASPAGLARSIMVWLRSILHLAGENLQTAVLAHALEGDDDEGPRLLRDSSDREPHVTQARASTSRSSPRTSRASAWCSRTRSMPSREKSASCSPR